MELSQIRYFVAVAQMENMLKAADQVHVTQPALSKAISKLESELGCELLTRNGRHVSLNENGELFLKGALAILRELDETTFALQEKQDNPVSRITVGVSGHDGLLLDALMDFVHNNEGVRLSLVSCIESYDNLDINQFDMLIYPASSRYKKFIGTPLSEQSYYLAVAKGYPLSKEGVIRVESLHDIPMVFIRYGNNTPEESFELCLGRGFYPKVCCYTDSIDLHRQIIATGKAVGFVREGCMQSYVNDSRLRLIPVLDDSFKAYMNLCFKRDKHLSLTAKALKDHILDYLHTKETLDESRNNT